MSGGQPQQDFTELAQLAARISRHLAMHPNDSQAQDDYKYVTGKMQGPSGATAAANTADQPPGSQPTSGWDIAAGVGRGLMDIPKGIGQTVMHPLQALGQATGLANLPAAVKTWNDPESSIAEDLDALVRATPFNLGYAPERALLDATGAKSDEPDTPGNQAERATNVASLALLGVKPAGPIRYLGNRLLPPALRPPILDAFLNKAPAVAEAAESSDPYINALRKRLTDLNVAPAKIEQMVAQAAKTRPGATGATPSGVAPTVPDDPDAAAARLPGPPPPDPLDQPTYQRTAGIPPDPNGNPLYVRPDAAATKSPLPAVGVDAPPAQPAPDQQPPAAGEQVNPAAQQAAQAKIASDQAAGLRGEGGMPRWSRGALPADALGTTDLSSKAAHLKQLLAMPEAQYQAGKGLLPPEIAAQVDQLRQAGATPDHVDALLNRSAQPADVSGTASTMRNPMYAKAAQIAQQVVKNPTLAEKYGYAGMSPEQVTRALQQRMLQAGKIPPLTSLAKFLARLHGG